jgi:hypothetical protein
MMRPVEDGREHDMSTKRLVIHHDDLGGSHAANMAFAALWEMGAISAGSVMVPCPWFPEIAAMARARPDYDLGVHLTLNSEFAAMRWRPLTGVADNGLTDADGFFPKTVEAVRKADPDAVLRELRAQVGTALAAGINATHLDSHMGAVWYPEFIDIFEELGREFSLPIVLSRDMIAEHGGAVAYAPLLARLEARGNPVFDAFPSTPFGNPDPQPADYAAILDGVPDGLSYAAFHFTVPGQDIEAVTPDASTRIGDYRVFSSGAVKRMLEDHGIKMVGMRGLA